MKKNIICDLEIKVLTPIHIWNWETISWIDYFCYQDQIKEKKHKKWKFDQVYKSYLYKYKIAHLIEILDKEDKDEFKKILLDSNSIELRNKIWFLLKDKEKKEYKQRLEKERDKEKENSNYKKREYLLKRYEKWKYKKKFLEISESPIEVSNKFFSDYLLKMSSDGKQINWKTEEKKKNEYNNQVSQLQINEFINSLGRHYIPWSSLKGAIRTVLTNENIQESKIENDPFKKLIIRDSEIINKWIEIWPLARVSKKQGKVDGIYAEFLKPWVIINTQIIIKSFLDEKTLEEIIFTKENIIQSSNKYIKQKIEKYIQELKLLKLKTISEEKKQKIDTSIISFNKILKEFKSLTKDEFILNLWFGWWYWFKCFSWNENHPDMDWISKKSKLRDYSINIPRTNYNTKLEKTSLDNLWFIKCKFID